MVQSQQPKDLTIGKFAAAADVGVETVRFYQRRGLLSTPKRIDGFRHYGESDVSRLRFIRQAQAAGFTLEEIRQLLALDSGEDRAAAREMASKRIAELDARMEALQHARASLQKLVSECAVGKTGPCPILKSFGA
ncbi:MerR family transcriptional regulator [Shinella sp. M31]|jgi:MerR family mercuric resistance operon transcriptional regulator|uniref:MerR family transcriptional regulator n=1 Tax=Shinella sp. M31 TaxID=3368615 RepID=UPI003BA1C0C8